MLTATITPLEPLIARDSRPFGSGSAHDMKCLDWFYPSVSAGTIRTLTGKMLNLSFKDPDTCKMLKNISVHGPLPCSLEDKGGLYFPAPRDILIYRKEEKLSWTALRPEPLKEGEGCTIPSGLHPVTVKEEIKPESGPSLWSAKSIIAWLTEETGSLSIPEKESSSDDFLFPLKKDERTHVKIDPDLGSAEEQMLFATEGLVFPQNLGMAVKITTDNEKVNSTLKAMTHIHQIGGEHRLAHFRQETSSQWDCPQDVAKALSGRQKIRMILATPALFKNGWLPGWLDPKTMEGAPPSISGLRLKLTGACVERWKPISGWSLEPLKSTGKAGPKALRRLVPAGSVYFFEVIAGESSALKDLWLQPVCDDDQDCRDGFGLSLWGTW